MAFNPVTSPLTLADAQSTYEGFKTPTTTAPKTVTASATPTQQTQTVEPQPQPTYVDPYAIWGGKAGYDKAVGDFNSGKDVAYGSIGMAEDTAANKYKGNILDFVDQYGAGQRAIDRSATQNELTRAEGRQNVLDMVGTGIRSGGVMLNNSNAANSSAGEAIARAYSEVGRKNLSKVGNQYELGQNNILGQQEDLGRSVDTFKRHNEETKVETVNNIVADATSKLAALNAQAANASLSERIQIEQEKARIRNETLGKLSAFDAELQRGVSANAAKTPEQNHAEAMRLLQSGVAPENSFNFTTATPSLVSSTGPSASNLPIFVGSKRPEEGV